MIIPILFIALTIENICFAVNSIVNEEIIAFLGFLEATILTTIISLFLLKYYAWKKKNKEKGEDDEI